MQREWKCTSCAKWVTVESGEHGHKLMRVLHEQHRRVSPACERDGPLDGFDIAPLRPDQRAGFLNYLREGVAGAEAAADSGTLDHVQFVVVKNDLVWFDCQLGTDGEAVQIYKEIETLTERVSKLTPN